MTALTTAPKSVPAPQPATEPTVPQVPTVFVGPRRQRLFTRAEYHRMAEAGILGDDEKLELIEGEIVLMASQGPRHGGRISRFDYWLNKRLGGRAVIRPQLPLVLDDFSEPEPDFAIVGWRDDFYEDSHPVVADVVFLVEVMDTSGPTDRRDKLPLYARHGVPEVWLVDLPRRWVEVYREPRDGEYTVRLTVQDGGELSPTGLPDVTFPAADLLGPPPADPPGDSPPEDAD